MAFDAASPLALLMSVPLTVYHILTGVLRQGEARNQARDGVCGAGSSWWLALRVEIQSGKMS